MQQHPLYRLAALRALEARAAAAGIDLMARAGQAIADWVAARLAANTVILVAVGPGNNGGDALIAAALLRERGYRITLVQPQPAAGSEARQAEAAWRDAGGEAALTTLPRDYPRPDLVIDGLFGIGLSPERPLGPVWRTLIQRINALGAPVLALDTPSGLDPYRGAAQELTVHATATLTFLCHKPGLFTGDGADAAGKVHLATLDHPAWGDEHPEGALNQPAAASRLIRPRNSHKGSFGHVAVAGGCPGMLGAALLAGRAALSAGAGKVTLCTLDDRLPVDPAQPELMIRPADRLPDCEVLAIGPGLGQDAAAQALLDSALDFPGLLVVDADALNLLARDPQQINRLALRRAPAVLTPHPAEAARLLDCDTRAVQADRIAAARALAARTNAVVVLKGAGSLIVGPDGYYHVNTSGGPALAAAGQGDVLTGLIAALLAQRLEPFDAASLAVHVHGLAGDRHQLRQGGPIGLTASAAARDCAAILNRLIADSAGRRPEGLTFD